MTAFRVSGRQPALALFLLTVALHAQQNVPHAGYIYPAGGRQGDTFEVIVGGQFLDGVTAAILSGPGVQATIVEHVKPMSQAQFNKLRDQLQELMDKKKAATAPWSPDDDKTVADLRLKIATFIRRPMTPAIAENVRLQIHLDPTAAPGDRQLRLLTPSGLTNPIVFCIGQLPEFAKQPAKVSSEIAPRPRTLQMPMPPKPAVDDITLPTIVNGQITPGGVDRYRFSATKGQHLVIAAAVRELIPYISDAVPGWFQAAIALYDGAGKELTYADHYSFHQDPVLLYQIPSDGTYTLAIHDSIYRGREDFVYRIAVGELPYLTSIFPLGGKAGQRTAIELKGWNLPTTRLTREEKAPGVYPVALSKGDLISNSLPFAVDTPPEILSREPNDTPATAQRIKLPVIINGRIEKPGDWDIFRIDGHAGEEIVAEVVARRLDSPLDSILKLTDAKGKQLALNDDFDDKGAGILTHQADSFLQFKLPATGTYYLSLGDTQRKGGPDYAYRLRISHPQPDFQLRMTPSSVSARGGLAVPITVYALRKDGFTGEIELKLKDPPAGFVLNGAWIPAHQNSVRLTLTLPPKKFDEPLDLHLEGRAKIDGKEVTREGIPAEDMMQAFAYHHLINEDAWMVRVATPARGRNIWKVLTGKPVQLPVDGQAPPVKVFLPLGRNAVNVRLVLNDPPEGIVIDKVGLYENGVNIFLRATAKAKPGLAGNLLIDAFLEIENPNNNAKKRRTALGLLPAIPFTVSDGPESVKRAGGQ